MKRILALVCVIVGVIALAGCADKPVEGDMTPPKGAEASGSIQGAAPGGAPAAPPPGQPATAPKPTLQ